jgi:hypothetical protein
MSTKFFRNHRAVYKFDPENCKSFVYQGGVWRELNEPDRLDEIRYRTVELSLAEAASRCGANAM